MCAFCDARSAYLGSFPDGIQNLISKYIHHINVFISEPDKGIFDAMNKSLKYVTGEYVIFIGYDRSIHAIVQFHTTIQ